MNAYRVVGRGAGIISLIALTLLPINSAFAHCDGLDGPVVKAARKALASGDVNIVLIWVQKGDETEVREAFDRTLAVRKLSREAQELADLYFFETLVRVHRSGEGAPYNGLQPAGRDLGPAIKLADEALVTGKIDPLLKLITEETRKGLAERFSRALKTSGYQATDVDEGREHVRAYVAFIHYVERIQEAAIRQSPGHFAEGSNTVEKHHD